MDEDAIDDVIDEYALEVMFQILESCSYTCKFIIHPKVDLIVGCGLNTLTFVDVEPCMLGEIPNDDGKVRALIALMKRVWEHILRDEVDPARLEALLPAIPLGSDFSWSAV